MNWITYAIMLWLMAGIDWGLRTPLELGQSGITPSLLIVLSVYVALYAGPASVWGAAVCAGAVIDLLRSVPTEGGQTTVVLGPSVLGCLLASAIVLNLRGLVFSKNVITLAILSGLGAGAANLTASMLLWIRSGYDVITVPSGQLGTALASAGYTGVAALIVGVALMPLRRLFAFSTDQHIGFRMV